MPSGGSDMFRIVRRIGLRECRDVSSALWALVCARAQLWRRPIGNLVAAEAPPPRATQPVPVEALRWARAVNRAVTYGPYRAKCLVRSIAIKRLLDRHGIAGSRVCVGVRNVGGKFAAHAWVDLAGHTIGDDAASVDRFERLDGIRLTSGR